MEIFLQLMMTSYKSIHSVSQKHKNPNMDLCKKKCEVDSENKRKLLREHK